MHASRLVAVGWLVASVVLMSCGGGSGGGRPPHPTAVTGTAASGAAIEGVTVTLKDATGASATGTTDSSGDFSIDTTGLTPPFLLQIDLGGGAVLYSVSADALASATINVTPLTDLIVRSWYEVQGGNVDEAFADPGANPPPAPEVVAVIADVVKTIVQGWLDQAGVDTSGLNLISTPFTAGTGTGVDGVLDEVTVDPSAGTIHVQDDPTDPTTVQDTSLTYAPADGSITVTTTTSGEDGDSGSVTTTAVPVDASGVSALDGINATFAAFAATVTSRGSSLQASDLAAYFSADYLNDGLDSAQERSNFVWRLGGLAISFSHISLARLDTASGLADVLADIDMTADGQTATMPLAFSLKKEGSSWLLYGNQQIAEVELRVDMVSNQGASEGPATEMLEVHVAAPELAPADPEQVVGASMTSADVWGATVQTLSVTGASDAPWGTLDTFEAHYFGLEVAAGTPFTFVVAKQGGGTATYTAATNAVTSEPIAVTGLLVDGSTDILGLSSMGDTHPGHPIDVTWTLPVTYPVQFVRLGSVIWSHGTSDTYKCETDQQLSGAATTGTVTFPATCETDTGATAPFGGEVSVQTHGANGELSIVYYTFGTTP